MDIQPILYYNIRTSCCFFWGGIHIQKNKIIVGTGKKEEIVEKERMKQDMPQALSGAETVHEMELEMKQEPVYESVWGNDYALFKQLDDETLAEKRLYVRVRYIQDMECSSMSEHCENELANVAPPLKFIIIDISMGGIGAICDEPLKLGITMAFQVTLDNMKYDVVYEVVYCIKMDGKYRIGLRLAKKDKAYTHHLKVYVARISLTGRYGSSNNS
jgi:hypothetical protein